jgi:hypothetical protein
LPQQPFHSDRWQLAAETVRLWFEIAERDFLVTMEATFNNSVTEIKRRSRK